MNTEPITQEDIDLVHSILEYVKPGKSPTKPDCKRLRRILAMFYTLTEEQADNCFCSQNDRDSFYNQFLTEWNKKDSVM